MPTEHDQFEVLHEYLDQGKLDQLSLALNALDPSDAAEFLQHIEDDRRSEVFALLAFEHAADVLAELGPVQGEEMVEFLDPAHVADLAEQMDPDDSADLLSEMEPKRSAEILAAMEPEERHEVTQLLQFEGDVAGHIMTPEIVAMPPSTTVAQVRERLRTLDMSDPILFIYVVEPRSGVLLGVVSLISLITANQHDRISDLAESEYPYALVDDDQEDVARKFRKYNLFVLPVVDREMRLAGRITVDDVLDIVKEEADEDLAFMVGAPDIEEDDNSPLRIARKRLPWLLITMFAGLLNSMVINSMMDATKIVAIAIFVPVILAMGGNTGMQAAAVCVRGIALGTERFNQLWKLVMREMSVGLALGLTCGSVTGLTVFVALALSHADTGGLAPASLGMMVGLAMANAMVFSSSFGAMVPLLLHRFRIDPAIASGPFVTTSSDLSATCIYFLTCLVMLPKT